MSIFHNFLYFCAFMRCARGALLASASLTASFDMIQTPSNLNGDKEINQR
jgi:hypothetical protein